MRRMTIVFSAFGLGLAAGAAEAACNIDEAGVVERHRALAEERGRLDPAADRSFRALRQTAEVLDLNGYAAACDAVVDAALRLLESEQAWTAAPVTAPALPEQEVGALNLHTFATAGVPVESGALVGSSVYGTTGQLLGEVDGVLLDQGRDASHLVVAHGGFWGAGEREIAIPSERMLVDAGTGRLYAEITADKLAEAPQYDGATWDAAANDAWYDAEAASTVAAAGVRALEARTAERQSADDAMARKAAPERPVATRTPDDDAPVANGPKRIRVEKDRPESAEGSND